MREKAEGAKAYIERKYAKLKNEEKEKKEGKIEMDSIVLAWDKLLKQMDKMQLTAEEKELIK
jgi:serine/threonine kinase 38